MAKKTEKLNIRLTAEAKDALRKLAFLEHRTISNLVEFMIFEKGKKHGIKIQRTNKNTE